ncbi:MAG: DUF1289 domain-containing protein [Rhodospirillales bacterium]|nr:DUF1289 domain-containing protein [Rhodospirillales bacterium]
MASPCVGVCRLDDFTNLCRGCLRTIDEIAAWRDAGDDIRQQILQRIAARKAVASRSRPRRRER